MKISRDSDMTIKIILCDDGIHHPLAPPYQGFGGM